MELLEAVNFWSDLEGKKEFASLSAVLPSSLLSTLAVQKWLLQLELEEFPVSVLYRCSVCGLRAASVWEKSWHGGHFMQGQGNGSAVFFSCTRVEDPNAGDVSSIVQKCTSNWTEANRYFPCDVCSDELENKLKLIPKRDGLVLN